MAKDPAFLFYPGDFLTGTQFFTNEQAGKYIRLLMAQHQHGHLSKKQMEFICGGVVDSEILGKFLKDEGCFFYNERLEIEIVKRQKHSKKQKENADMRWHKNGNAVAMPLENENRNENRNIIKNKKEIIIPSEKEFLEHCQKTLLIKYIEYEFSLRSKYQTWIDDGWKTGHGKPIKNWKNTINNTIPHLKPIYNGKQIGIKPGQQHPLQNLKDLSDAILRDAANKNG